jgi:hypothetical protein
MPGSRTQQQMARDRQDGKTLADASVTLRRLTGRRYYHGDGATLFAVCEVLDRASLEIAEVGLGVRGRLLQLARCVQQDARAAGAAGPGGAGAPGPRAPGPRAPGAGAAGAGVAGEARTAAAREAGARPPPAAR